MRKTWKVKKIYNVDKKCTHSMCLMTKIGLDYHCNTCGGVVLAGDDDFRDDEVINDYQAEVKEENDRETVNGL